MNFSWMVLNITSLAAFLGFGVGSLLFSCAVLGIVFRRSGYL